MQENGVKRLQTSAWSLSRGSAHCWFMNQGSIRCTREFTMVTHRWGLHSRPYPMFPPLSHKHHPPCLNPTITPANVFVMQCRSGFSAGFIQLIGKHTHVYPLGRVHKVPPPKKNHSWSLALNTFALRWRISVDVQKFMVQCLTPRKNRHLTFHPYFLIPCFTHPTQAGVPQSYITSTMKICLHKTDGTGDLSTTASLYQGGGTFIRILQQLNTIIFYTEEDKWVEQMIHQLSKF